MLGSVYDDVPYGTYPEVKTAEQLSEEEQVEIIERALHGDLKGILEVTEKDMDLYNRHRHGTETYANEYRKATEFSYIPKHKYKQVQEERAKAMGLEPPPSRRNNNQQQQSYYSNPVLSGYQAFNGGNTGYQQPRYQYPNTYYNPVPYGAFGYGGYGYYGNYQQPYDYGNPYLNYSMSLLQQSAIPQPSYYRQQPRQESFLFNPNQQISETENLIADGKSVFDDKIFTEGLDFGYIEIHDDIPKGFEAQPQNIYISIPDSTRNYMSQYSFYNNQNILRQQYAAMVAEENKRQAEFIEYLNECMFGKEEYEKIKAERTEQLNKLYASDYRRRYMYDSEVYKELSDSQRKMKMAEKANMDKVMSYRYYNPYNLVYDPRMEWQNIVYRFNNDRETQAMIKDMPRDMPFVEAMNVGFARYNNRKQLEDFYMKAHSAYMGYDSNRYRSILQQSGISANPYLGRTPVGMYNQPITDPNSITARYNERRNSYIREAEKRGGVS